MMQHCDLHDCEIDRRGCPWCLAESLEQQLSTAHREGWEQCHREASGLVLRLCGSGRNIADAIAAMAYEGKAND